MGEIFEGDVHIARTVVELPDYSKKEFDKLVQFTPEYYVEEGRVAGEAAKKLDSINIWWRKQHERVEEIDRLKKAVSLPGIPPLESKQALGIYEEAEESNNRIIWSLDLALKTSQPSWEKVETTAENIQIHNKNKPAYNQTLALCEAINDVREMGMSQEEIRQKIAQHAWNELMRMIPYAKMDEYEETTVDDTEEEKGELLEVFRAPLWDTEDRMKAGVEFRKYKGQMKKKGFDPDLRARFKFLYEATKGNTSKRKSAIDILKTQEGILRGLYDEDALQADEE